MYFQHRVAIVVPSHNEEAFIANTIESIPEFIDVIIAVDDGSQDDTLKEIAHIQHKKLHLIRHSQRLGVGAAVFSGYQLALFIGVDIIVVMDGDGQMFPEDLPILLDAIILGGTDYAKGNRFLHSSIKTMPRLRYLGNRILSLLTQSALGLKIPLDAQCGYTAITSKALAKLSQTERYPYYGYLNGLLFKTWGSCFIANIKSALICSSPLKIDSQAQLLRSLIL